MMYLRLHENGPEFPIGHDLLLGLARALKRRTSYPDLVTALLELRIPSLTKELLGARALETGHMDHLWESGDPNIRRALLSERVFIRDLTDKQAEDIIEDDDIVMLCHLVYWIELLEGDLSEQRLSPAKRDALWLYLRQHPDMRIRDSLADNPDLPSAIAIPVSERLRLGLDLNYSAFRSLRLDTPVIVHRLSSLASCSSGFPIVVFCHGYSKFSCLLVRKAASASSHKTPVTETPPALYSILCV